MGCAAPYTRLMQSFVPLNAPRPIQVTVDERGLPTAVVRGGQPVVVATIADTWRIDDEWWRDEISRLYYQGVGSSHHGPSGARFAGRGSSS